MVDPDCIKGRNKSGEKDYTVCKIWRLYYAYIFCNQCFNPVNYLRGKSNQEKRAQFRLICADLQNLQEKYYLFLLNIATPSSSHFLYSSTFRLVGIGLFTEFPS